MGLFNDFVLNTLSCSLSPKLNTAHHSASPQAVELFVQWHSSHIYTVRDKNKRMKETRLHWGEQTLNLTVHPALRDEKGFCVRSYRYWDFLALLKCCLHAWYPPCWAGCIYPLRLSLADTICPFSHKHSKRYTETKSPCIFILGMNYKGEGVWTLLPYHLVTETFFY